MDTKGLVSRFINIKRFAGAPLGKEDIRTLLSHVSLDGEDPLSRFIKYGFDVEHCSLDAERGDFGCQLSFADTEYELAWQIYEPRSTSPSQQETVAMVCDAAYHALDGDRFWVKKGGVGEWETYPKGEVVSEELSV
ncbi:hypothetical protein M427DRAFT_27925 [Gonapodya prolifera JEL478]|uniref:Uncharacterized protein n=1 Tax=Gonapodya prolifera (strain JEL478) TaxID=1344416 RepID=A0A139AVS5_GONPJ|nr:hypothetical protein M427DRAFT_27925 [Gonapodya prolifera JEL478]|eukprot:KXS20841.1 hypothetical protein M427DRAFT_27925 [Gonapodya prolifera JEL478]